MKNRIQSLAMTGIASFVFLTGITVFAQDNPPPGRTGDRGGRGRGFSADPAEFQKMRLERFREDLEIKDDAEWKAIEPLVTKVMDAQRDAFSGMGRGLFGRSRSRGNDNEQNDARRRFGPEPSAVEQALDKAIDSNASKDELKSAMAKWRAERKEKQARLEEAQENLKKVLSTKQEAVALTLGLVK